jgi:hypothetical protein
MTGPRLPRRQRQPASDGNVNRFRFCVSCPNPHLRDPVNRVFRTPVEFPECEPLESRSMKTRIAMLGQNAGRVGSTPVFHNSICYREPITGFIPSRRGWHPCVARSGPASPAGRRPRADC